MSRPLFSSLAFLAGALATSLAAFGGDAKAPAEAPKPPTTPEPEFDNPLADAKVGETLFYSVRDLEGKRPITYYEERVLALTKDKALIETIETDATDTKLYRVDNGSLTTGWRSRAKELKMGDAQKWLPERTKSEILFIGDPPTKAIRTKHRYLDEPKDFTVPTGPRRTREIWFSHDVPCTGRAKMYPAQKDGERMVISWSKVLSADECAERAGRYPEDAEKAGDSKPTAADPGMGEPGMDDAGMGEPAMDEPKKDEPKKDEPGMDAEPPTKPDEGMGS